MRRVVFCAIILFLALYDCAIALEGRVVAIIDGDTLSLESSNHQKVRVRLAEIDAPESSQPYGGHAKAILESWALGKVARIDILTQDRYGREVARVYVGDIDINAEMIRFGAAWVYRRYSQDATLLVLESQARQESQGLWQLPEKDRMPPWQWRAAQKAQKESASLVPVSNQTIMAAQFICGGKTKCGHMTSCAEAVFYYRQCGIGRLDGDKDGIPCEELCR